MGRFLGVGLRCLARRRPIRPLRGVGPLVCFLTLGGGEIAVARSTIAAIAPSAAPATASASRFAIAVGVGFAALRAGPGKAGLWRRAGRELAAFRLREARRLIVRAFAGLR